MLTGVVAADWPVALLLILIAPAVGSFLGVLVDRLPEGRDVIRARSRCAACGSGLGLRDMVPILSALGLRGRCRHCGAAIPGHLLRIEIAALAVALAAVALVPGTLQMVLSTLFLWLLVGLFYCDLIWFRLPNVLTGALALTGLALGALDPARGWADALLSGAIASGVFWGLRSGYRLLRARDGMGLGDVKMMAGIGAALGWMMVPWVALIAASLGLAVALLRGVRGSLPMRGDTRLPFGSFLAVAAGLLLLF